MECKSLCGNINCKHCFEKSFASSKKSQYLRDKDINTLLIYKNSHKKYEFDCVECGHTFASALNNVICLGRWCPFCRNQKLCEKDDCRLCFEKSFANNVNSKYWSSKNQVSPRQIFMTTKKEYIFSCDVCNHKFNMKPQTLANNKGCPFCAVPSQRLCESNECDLCFNRSFASEEASINWSNTNSITPRHVFKNTHTKYWFKCDVCCHEHESTPNHKTYGNDCPYCAKYSDTLCKNNDCSYCFNKSFASIVQSKHWSSKNQTQPRDYTKQSSTQHLFSCDVCNHEFKTSISHITNGKWCPYCCIPTNKICQDADCQHCFTRSFASHENAKHWSKNNELTARHYIKNSSMKCWFSCEHCGVEYQSVLSGMKPHSSYCSSCINKTEKKLYKWLCSLYDDVEIHKSFEWCVWKRKCIYDFVIESKKVIIELDGEQHFVQVASWTSPDDVRERDVHKMKKANENGYNVIRILQKDVYQDKNDWMLNLTSAIDLSNKNVTPQNVYISNEKHYNKHMEDMGTEEQ